MHGAAAMAPIEDGKAIGEISRSLSRGRQRRGDTGVRGSTPQRSSRGSAGRRLAASAQGCRRRTRMLLNSPRRPRPRSLTGCGLTPRHICNQPQQQQAIAGQSRARVRPESDQSQARARSGQATSGPGPAAQQRPASNRSTSKPGPQVSTRIVALRRAAAPLAAAASGRWAPRRCRGPTAADTGRGIRAQS